MTREKTIAGWLVIDWKKETHRTRKSKPDSLGTNELLAKLSVDVEIPEVDVPELALQIDVPEAQVHAATLEALDDEQLPDWSDVANEVVAENEPKARNSSGHEFYDVADELTAKVLLNVESRPDPEQVRQYVFDQMKRIESGDGDTDEK